MFYDITQQTAHETIAFAAGECVQYAEQFTAGADGDGAYVCQLTITAPSFELRAGGPVAVVALESVAVGGTKELAGTTSSLAIGGGGFSAVADGAAKAVTASPLAIARAVNPLKGTSNCSQITEAVIARLHGTDPLAVAPNASTRTIEEIEAIYQTSFEPVADFHTIFEVVG